MSRKHYKALAEAFRQLRPPKGEEETWFRLLKAVAQVSKADNPNFKADRFYEAAGTTRVIVDANTP